MKTLMTLLMLNGLVVVGLGFSSRSDAQEALTKNNPNDVQEIKIKKVLILRGGSNTGGSGRSSGGEIDPTPEVNGPSHTQVSGRAADFPVVNSWCTNQRAVLDNMMMKFDLDVNHGDKAGAIVRWKQGFRQALNQAPRGISEASLTWKVLTRGLEMIDRVADAVKDDPNGLETEINIAQAYYQFLSKKVSKIEEFNLRYRFNYECEESNSCSTAAPQPSDQFEDAYLEYARSQLSWIIGDDFTTDNPEFGVAPKWSAQAFIVLTQLVTGYVVEDLNTSPWAVNYSCLSTSLQLLESDIKNDELGDIREMSNIVFGKLKTDVSLMQPKNYTCQEPQ